MKIWIHIGPGKSGSTWLYNMACSNGHIFSLPTIKETQTFHHHAEIDLGFYKQDSSSSHKILCDFSNTYIFNPVSLSNIQSFVRNSPDHEVLLTSLLRCPLKRSLSHYKYLSASGLIPGRHTLEDLLEEEPSFLLRSRYDLFMPYISSLNMNVNYFTLHSQGTGSSPAILKFILNACGVPLDSLNNSKQDTFSGFSARNRFLSLLAKQVSYVMRDRNPATLSVLKNSSIVRSIIMKKDVTHQPVCSDLTLGIMRSFLEPTKSYCHNIGLDVSDWLL